MNSETKRKRSRTEERGWNRKDFDQKILEFAYQNAIVTTDTRNVGAFEYNVRFSFDKGTMVTVTILLKEWQTDSDVVITAMTTLPESERQKGYGRNVIERIIAWSKSHGWNEIRATQVSDEGAKEFWKKMGFLRVPPPNKTGDYVRVIV